MLDKLKASKLEVTERHYFPFIEYYGRNGNLEQLNATVEEMKAQKIEPSYNTINTILL